MTTLQWYRADEHHQRTSCGRFSIARVKVGLYYWYEAYRWPGAKRGDLLGATRVPVDASNDERKRVFEDLKLVCEAQATVDSPPTPKEIDDDTRLDEGPRPE